MPRYMDAVANRDLTIKVQWAVIAILAVIAFEAIRGLERAPHEMTIHVPPDLRSGATLKPGEIPPANVYAFGHYIWQQLNHWATDGDTDYGQAIYRMQAYITPSCRDWLQQDLAKKSSNGELSLRTRGLQELPGHAYAEAKVIPQSADAWRLELDYELQETVRGIPVKDVGIRYPLRIVRYSADPDQNPFGMAVDCFTPGEEPGRLDLVAERKAAVASAPAAAPAASAAGRTGFFH